MNVKEAKSRWHVSVKTVRDYCKEGIIPEATKIKRSLKNLVYEEWDIPDIDKPPARRNGLVKYMKFIIVINEGAKPRFSKSYSEIKKIYKYLADSGFITSVVFKKNIYDSLRGVHITSLGQELIKKECPNVSEEFSAKVSANLGVINSELSSTKKINT